jgi:hypothetical protein
MTVNIESLKEILKESQVRVEFTKVDGTHRSMVCTKNINKIPVSSVPNGTGKKANDTVISVFDIEKTAWRSIKVANIQSWSIEDS